VRDAYQVEQIEKINPETYPNPLYSPLIKEKRIDILLKLVKYSRKSFLLTHLLLYCIKELSNTGLEIDDDTNKFNRK
jgi:hypothetical protein